MIRLLAFRNLTLNPWRTLFLLFGFSMGVAVMIVLLSVGEALLDQAKDEKLVGGGSITVLPEGVDVEVLKTGGLGGLFFSIDHARFIHRQLLAAPRLRDVVSAVAPQIEGKLLYLRTSDGRERPVRAGGDIPSLTRAVGAGPSVASGTWGDDALDVQWHAPSDFQLRNEIDHFHLPPAQAAGDPSWAEWHYFNVISPDRKEWAFVSFIVAGEVGAAGRWGGQVLVTLHAQGEPARRFTSSVPAGGVRFSTTDADLRIGESQVEVLPDGRYRVHAVAREDAGGAPLTLDLVVAPSAGAYFPGAALTSGVVSGYVVPALRADATGKLCVGASCRSYDGVQAYHDHNWGVWRGVTWEWGAARVGEYTLLYGRVEPPDSAASVQPLFVYLVDRNGFLAVFRPRAIRYVDGRTTRVGGATIRTPSTAELVDVRGADTLTITLAIEDAAASDTRQSMVERGDALAARKLARPYFVQMKGTATLSGRIRGTPLAGSGAGFFETYR
ncbi:MAG: MacB-like periplasmic core domain protein [Gemmatimonadetes bacterium]|nr:MacB-like periplasmic core domain protein [Gemmatimonadota bacterium]